MFNEPFALLMKASEVDARHKITTATWYLIKEDGPDKYYKVADIRGQISDMDLRVLQSEVVTVGLPVRFVITLPVINF